MENKAYDPADALPPHSDCRGAGRQRWQNVSDKKIQQELALHS